MHFSIADDVVWLDPPLEAPLNHVLVQFTLYPPHVKLVVTELRGLCSLATHLIQSLLLLPNPVD